MRRPRPVTGPHPETGEPTTWPGLSAAAAACGVTRRAVWGWLEEGRTGWSAPASARANAKPWSDAETEALTLMARNGVPDSEIAAALGRPQSSVRGKRTATGIETAIAQGRPRVHCRRTIGAMLDDGLTQAEITRRLGMHRTTVQRIAAEIR